MERRSVESEPRLSYPTDDPVVEGEGTEEVEDLVVLLKEDPQSVAPDPLVAVVLEAPEEMTVAASVVPEAAPSLLNEPFELF